MQNYEVLKTTVLGIGPWYVSPKGCSDVLGVFRDKEDAQIFAEAKMSASQPIIEPDAEKSAG